VVDRDLVLKKVAVVESVRARLESD